MLRATGREPSGATVGELAMNDEMRVRDIPAVLVSAARILRTYWAPFVVIACLGLAVRSGALWIAVEVSDHNAFLAQLILVIAPLGFLLAMIAMLYMTRGALPNVAELSRREARQATTEKREMRLVDVAVSVLVPFLAVYVSYGLLKEDLYRFTNEAAYDEFNQFSLDGPTGGRLRRPARDLRLAGRPRDRRHRLGAALRPRQDRERHPLPLARVPRRARRGLLHLAGRAEGHRHPRGRAWRGSRSRRASQLVLDRYDQVVETLGPMANPVDTATAWLFGLLGAIDAVVIVPLAWLTVGAVVLGHKLSPPEAPERQPPNRALGAHPRAASAAAVAGSSPTCASAGRPSGTACG